MLPQLIAHGMVSINRCAGVTRSQVELLRQGAGRHQPRQKDMPLALPFLCCPCLKPGCNVHTHMNCRRVGQHGGFYQQRC
jgi:hypothetical protein